LKHFESGVKDHNPQMLEVNFAQHQKIYISDSNKKCKIFWIQIVWIY